MSGSQLIFIGSQIRKLGEEVRKHLGCGFEEPIFQEALAIEFRKGGIEYLKEVNIEIFYKGENVGVDRPDFVITKMGACRRPVVLEIKVTDNITDNHRTQLKSYCTSLPRNANPVLRDFIGGVLLTFPSCDAKGCGGVKIVAVSSDFRIIKDDQAEEDERVRKEKEDTKVKKKAARK